MSDDELSERLRELAGKMAGAYWGEILHQAAGRLTVLAARERSDSDLKAAVTAPSDASTRQGGE